MSIDVDRRSSTPPPPRPLVVVGQFYAGPVADDAARSTSTSRPTISTLRRLDAELVYPLGRWRRCNRWPVAALTCWTEEFASNFLTGGTGRDTFFVDNRGGAADIVEYRLLTLQRRRCRDDLGSYTLQDFLFEFEDSQGAAGFTGLTLHTTAPGRGDGFGHICRVHHCGSQQWRDLWKARYVVPSQWQHLHELPSKLSGLKSSRPTSRRIIIF